MVMGRPREIAPPPEEVIELGKEMVNWVIENEPYILHLSDWYTLTKMFTYNYWKLLIKLEEFRPYYEKALKIVGRKYLDKDSKVRNGVAERWQRVYFADLREQEDADLDAASERAKKVAEIDPTKSVASLCAKEHTQA